MRERVKTINFELSKSLNKWGLLDDIYSEYYYNSDGIIIENVAQATTINYKTLTTEEAIDFLPRSVRLYNSYPLQLIITKTENKYYVYYGILGRRNIVYEGKTLIEAIENMIEYLLDNNLLGGQK